MLCEGKSKAEGRKDNDQTLGLTFRRHFTWKLTQADREVQSGSVTTLQKM